MPYVIKHKRNPRYVGKLKTADYDSDGLVSYDFANFYTTERGAKLAMTSFCKYPVSRLINKAKLDTLEIVKVGNN